MGRRKKLKQTAAGFSSDRRRSSLSLTSVPTWETYWLFPPLTFLRSDFSVSQTSPNLVFQQIAKMFLSKFAKVICPNCQMYLSLSWLWEKPKNCVFHLNFSFVDRKTSDLKLWVWLWWKTLLILTSQVPRPSCEKWKVSLQWLSTQLHNC